MKYPAGQWRRAARDQRGGSLPGSSPTEEGHSSPTLRPHFSLCPGPGGSPKGLSEPWVALPYTCPPRRTFLVEKGLAGVRRPRAGREPRLLGPMPAGASARRECVLSKSCARTGACGPALTGNEKGGLDRVPGNPRPAPPQIPARTRGAVQTCPEVSVSATRESRRTQWSRARRNQLNVQNQVRWGRVSANLCALLLARPWCWASAGGGACAHLGVLGNLAFPGSPRRAPCPSSPALGIPPPSTEIPVRPLPTFAKARKRPSRRQRNSNLLHSRPLRPPQTPPGPLPRPPATTRGQAKEGEAGWASLFLRGPAGGCQSSRPGTSRGSRAPALRCADSPGPPAPPPRVQISSSPPLLPSDRGRGAQTKRVQGWIRSAGVWKKSRPGSNGLWRSYLFTRFLLRSPRCLRR